VQDRGLAAYIAELVGTLFLVLVVGTVVSLYVSTSPQSQTGSDFAVVGLVHAFALFLLIIAFGQASGGHFNPAITVAAWASRRIDPVDAVVYILAQLSGAVLGALLVKGILLDEGRASDYGAAGVGAVCDRRHAWLRRDDLRPAHRRLVQSGALVRSGADR
jgi:glycerol uptake facilitator protein